MSENTLFDVQPAPPSRNEHFDGPDYDPKRDSVRLAGQLFMVWEVMNDGRWRTVEEISRCTGGPPTSISAQLRNLRKPRYGAYLVERRRVTESGLYEYRVGEKGAGSPQKASCANCARLERIIVELMKEGK